MLDKIFNRRARRYIFITIVFLIVTTLVFTFGSGSTLDTKDPTSLRSETGTDSTRSNPNKQLSPRLENATFLTLCRDSDLESALQAVQSWEDRFNGKFHYDWVFLNNKEFSVEFKESISSLASGNVQFGLVGKKMWDVPEHIDSQRAKDAMARLRESKVPYADSIPYRQMCRFYSGFFQDHELLKPYKYYWRVDPDTKLYCDIDYDVFKYMREHKKQYGFVLAFKEFRKTVPTLWQSANKFFKANPQHMHPNAGLDFVKYKDNEDLAMCHFWSNFEIGDMDFFRSNAYREYFQSLDQDGGFFYERWGDAPVHSIAISAFMDKKAVHFFEDVGYKHGYYQHTPENAVSRGLKCSLRSKDSVDWVQFSCLRNANTAFELGLQDPSLAT